MASLNALRLTKFKTKALCFYFINSYLSDSSLRPIKQGLQTLSRKSPQTSHIFFSFFVFLCFTFFFLLFVQMIFLNHRSLSSQKPSQQSKAPIWVLYVQQPAAVIPQWLLHGRKTMNYCKMLKWRITHTSGHRVVKWWSTLPSFDCAMLNSVMKGNTSVLFQIILAHPTLSKPNLQ